MLSFTRIMLYPEETIAPNNNFSSTPPWPPPLTYTPAFCLLVIYLMEARSSRGHQGWDTFLNWSHRVEQVHWSCNYNKAPQRWHITYPGSRAGKGEKRNLFLHLSPTSLRNLRNFMSFYLSFTIPGFMLFP